MNTETHNAIVMAIDADEPKPRGRIKVACAALLGDEKTVLPMWVEPLLEWGWFIVPDVGEVVEIEVVTGSETDEVYGQASIDSLDIKWKGRRTNIPEGEGQVESRPVHEDFTSTNYGKRRGFATPTGHIIYFDDTEGKEKVHISWKQGADKYQFLSMDDTGSIILANKNGTMIFMDAENKTFTIIDENSNLISMDPDEVKIIDHRSNMITMADGLVQVISQDALVLSGKSLNANFGTIDLLDGADGHLVKGEILKTWLESHVHPDGMGGTGPPAIPLPATALSEECKVK